jgi:hypothetical protein
MEAFRKQASKFKEQVAKQQQVGTIRDLIIPVSLSLCVQSLVAAR